MHRQRGTRTYMEHHYEDRGPAIVTPPRRNRRPGYACRLRQAASRPTTRTRGATPADDIYMTPPERAKEDTPAASCAARLSVKEASR